MVQSSQRVSNDAVQFLVQQLPIGRELSVFEFNDSIVVDSNLIRLPVPVAQRFARDVLGDSKQPGRELRVVPERFQILISAHESFLRQLFGEVPVADHIINEADNGSTVAIEDQTKSFILAASGARNEF